MANLIRAGARDKRKHVYIRIPLKHTFVKRVRIGRVSFGSG